MRRIAAVAALLGLPTLLSCGLMDGGGGERTETPRKKPPNQEAMRNKQIQIQINVNFNYTPKDQLAARQYVPDKVLSRLNADASADGNTFVVANGVEPNLYLDITISNDGNDHLSAYATARTWAGDLPASSGQHAYVDPESMLNALADAIYKWFHTGWTWPD